MEVVKNIDDDIYKIICFSDIHGNKEALESVLSKAKNENPNEIVFLGDAISKGPDNKECLRILKNENVTYLQGNNEYKIINEIEDNITETEKNHLNWLKDCLDETDKEFIKSLPTKYVINFKKKNLQFSHFLFGKDEKFVNLAYLIEKGINRVILNNNNYDFVFYGHNHDFTKETTNEKTFISVGSSGCTKDKSTNYITIIYDHGVVEIKQNKIPYNFESFKQRMEETNYPGHDHYMKSIFDIK